MDFNILCIFSDAGIEGHERFTMVYSTDNPSSIPMMPNNYGSVASNGK